MVIGLQDNDNESHNNVVHAITKFALMVPDYYNLHHHYYYINIIIISGT